MQSYLHIAEDSSFPLESIPFGVVSTHKNPEYRFPATRIGKAKMIQVMSWSAFRLLRT